MYSLYYSILCKDLDNQQILYMWGVLEPIPLTYQGMTVVANYSCQFASGNFLEFFFFSEYSLLEKVGWIHGLGGPILTAPGGVRRKLTSKTDCMKQIGDLLIRNTLFTFTACLSLLKFTLLLYVFKLYNNGVELISCFGWSQIYVCCSHFFFLISGNGILRDQIIHLLSSILLSFFQLYSR